MDARTKKSFWKELEDTPTDEASQSDGESSAKQYGMSLYKARTANPKIDPRKTYNIILDSHLSDSISQRNVECMMNMRNPEPRNVMPVCLASTSNVRKSETTKDSDSAGRNRNRYSGLNSESKKHLNNNNNREKRPDDVINDDSQQIPFMIQNHWDDAESWNQEENESASDSRGKTDTPRWHYEGGKAEDQQTTFSEWMRSPDGRIHLRNYKLNEQWDEHMWKPTSSANKQRERFYGSEQEQRTFTDEVDNVNAEGNEHHFCHANQKDDTLIWRDHGINVPYNCNVLDVSHFSDEGDGTSESDKDFSVEIDEDMVNKSNNREYFQHSRCKNNENRHRRDRFDKSFGMENLDFNHTENPDDIRWRSSHLGKVETVNNRIDFAGMDMKSKHQNRRKKNTKNPEDMMEDIDISVTKEKEHHETARYENALFRNFQTNQDCSIPVIGCNTNMNKYGEHLIKNGRMEDGESNPEDFFLKINTTAEKKKILQQQKMRHDVEHQKIEYSEKNYQSDDSDYNIWNCKNDPIFDDQRCNVRQSNCESCGNNNIDCVCRKYGNCNDNSKDDSPSSDLSDRFGDLSEESDGDDKEYESFSGDIRVNTSQSVLRNSQNYSGRINGGQRLIKNLRKPKKKSREISKNLEKKTHEPIHDYSPQQDHHINYADKVSNSMISDLVNMRQNKFPQSSRYAQEDASKIKEVREHFGNSPQENIKYYQQTGNGDNLEYSTRFLVPESNTKARQYKPNIRKNEKSQSTFRLSANQINGWTGISDPNDPLVDLRDSVSCPNERFVYEDKKDKIAERMRQYNERMKAGRSRNSAPRNPRINIGRQGSTCDSLQKNLSETSELPGKQILAVKSKDFSRCPQKDETDVTDLFEKQKKMLDFGQQISCSLKSSHLAKQLFLSMYHEWLTMRERTITLLQKILENIQECEGWHETFIQNWNSEFQSVKSTAATFAETHDNNESGIAKSLKTFWKKISSSSTPSRATVTFDISAQDVCRILEEDVTLSGEIQMFGLQCITQFKETNKLMKNFRDIVVKDQLFENLQYENFQNFLMAIVRTDPDDISFCEEVSKAYEKLIDSVDEDDIPVIAHDAFCKFLKEDATILKTIKSVNWNPCTDFNGSYEGLKNEGSEAITHFAKDFGSRSKTYMVQNIVETLTVLIAEKKIFGSDAAFLL